MRSASFKAHGSLQVEFYIAMPADCRRANQKQAAEITYTYTKSLK